MDQQVKFNVIIPTRERCDTLFHCLKTVLAQTYENLSIIVSDNFSQDDTKKVVDSFADPRITYINTGKRVSMSHNWEFALSHVTDGWVSFLGDDDGMLPGGLQRIAKIINETSVRAVTSVWKFYFWPHTTNAQNTLTVPLTTGYEIRNGVQWLAKLMAGDADYFDLPWLYTGGFAEIGLINQARKDQGNFFCSMTPDVYSAVALAASCDRYIMLNEPVCLMGVSSHSNGASNFGMGTSAKPSQLFYSEPNIPFHTRLSPKPIKSIHLLNYECYLQAGHVHKDVLRIDLQDQLRLALSKVSPEIHDEVLQYCVEVAESNNVRLITDRIKEDTVQKLRKRLSSAFQDFVTVDASYYGVHNVYDAVLLSEKLYRDNVMSAWSFFYRCRRITHKIVVFLLKK